MQHKRTLSFWRKKTSTKVLCTLILFVVIFHCFSVKYSTQAALQINPQISFYAWILNTTDQWSIFVMSHFIELTAESNNYFYVLLVCVNNQQRLFQIESDHLNSRNYGNYSIWNILNRNGGFEFLNEVRKPNNWSELLTWPMSSNSKH